MYFSNVWRDLKMSFCILCSYSVNIFFNAEKYYLYNIYHYFKVSMRPKHLIYYVLSFLGESTIFLSLSLFFSLILIYTSFQVFLSVVSRYCMFSCLIFNLQYSSLYFYKTDFELLFFFFAGFQRWLLCTSSIFSVRISSVCP